MIVKLRAAGIDVGASRAGAPGSARTSFSIGLMNSSVRWIAGAARQPHVDAELALVVVGHELLADVRIEERRRQRRPRRRSPSSPRRWCSDHSSIAPVQPRPSWRRSRPTWSSSGPALTSSGFSHHAHSAGVSVNDTNIEMQNRRRRGDAEAVEVAADLAGHERHRHEDHDQRQRRRHHRQADLRGRLRPPPPWASRLSPRRTGRCSRARRSRRR